MLSFMLLFLSVACFSLLASCNHLTEDSAALDLEKDKYLGYLKSSEHNQEVLALLHRSPGTRHKWAVEFLYLAARYGNHELALGILGRGVFLFQYEAFNYRFHREIFFSTLYPLPDSLSTYKMWEYNHIDQGARHYIKEKLDCLEKDWSFLPDAEALCESIASATAEKTSSKSYSPEVEMRELMRFHILLNTHGKYISEALRLNNSALFKDYIVCNFKGQMFGILTSHYLELVYKSHPSLILDNASFIDTWFRPRDKRGYFFELAKDDRLAEDFLKCILDFVLASTSGNDAILKRLFPYIAGSAWHGKYSYHRSMKHYVNARKAATESATADRPAAVEAAVESTTRRIASKDVPRENSEPKTI